MKKTPAVAFYSKRLKLCGHKELYEALEDAPLNTHDYAFLSDIIEGLSNKSLSKKYHKSPSRISQWKRSVFEKMHDYELHKAEWEHSRNS